MAFTLPLPSMVKHKQQHTTFAIARFVILQTTVVRLRTGMD